ncbi:MAG: anti-sigma factor family protein [Planctomycetota bacterium]|jgi:anti-sigma factor RsiW
MNCTQFRSCSGAFADGELDGFLNREAADHIGLCPDCALHVEGIHRLKSALKRTLDGGPAPLRLRNRIIASLETVSATGPVDVDQPPPVLHAGQRYIYLVPMSFAAALALTAAVWMSAPRRGALPGRTVDAAAKVVKDVRAQHRACVARRGTNHHDPSLSRDPATIAERLSERLGLAVIAPDLSDDEFELLGADRCGIPGHNGAHVLYRSSSTGATLSVYTVESVADMKPNTASLTGDCMYFTATEAAPAVLAWHEAEQTYISCGDVGRTRILDMMGRVRVGRGPPAPRFWVAMLSPGRN